MPDAHSFSPSARLEDILGAFDGLSEMSVDVASALKAISDRPQELRAFKPRALARTALAAASALPMANVRALAVVCERVAEAELERFETVELSMLAWALAAADHRDVAAMSAIGDQIAERAWEFATEDLAKTVFAFAELRLQHQAMMTTVSMEVMWKIDQFSAHDLAQIAASCASLGFCKEPMFDWVAARVIGRLEDYRLQDLCTVFCAFAEASIKNDALAATIASEVSKRSTQLDDELLSRFTWAFGRMGVAPLCVSQPLYYIPMTV
eukprot:gnl/TRDRNA2_/TRDRNA2_189994_c0_seq1.p1 gnl/TRDRNA2_/TRDRNA2_189994_c0~~gnl/TRDRNA2_/TRDRNA2_189994_c0_seq1.p1  ORF type:complete len:268 (+),score=60.54 gnl/TRDRNA2_/TRDRNA2_189994_c0_seq1:58-861(+)